MVFSLRTFCKTFSTPARSENAPRKLLFAFYEDLADKVNTFAPTRLEPLLKDDIDRSLAFYEDLADKVNTFAPTSLKPL